MQWIGSGPIVSGLCVAALGLLSKSIWAVEPAEDFLNQLRQRGYHDLAIEYLERATTSHVVPQSFKDRIDYEKGVTLLESATRRPANRRKLLQLAQLRFEEFARDHPNHQLSIQAESKRGVIVVQQARDLLRLADGAPNNTALLHEARSTFVEAEKLCQQNLTNLKHQLERLPKLLDPEKEKDKIEYRDQLRADYVQSQLVLANILYEKAGTWRDTPPQYKKALTAAAESYAQVASKYRRRLAGLYAVLYRGRCYQDIEDPEEALAIYQYLLDQSDDTPAIRTLKTKTFVQALECWRRDLKSPEFSQGVQQVASWIDQMRPSEANGSDWLFLRLSLARAYKQMVDTKLEPNRKQRLLTDATGLTRDVLKYPGPHHRTAQEFLVTLGRTNSAQELETLKDTKTFVEALAAGQEAQQEYESAKTVMKIVGSRLKTIHNVARRKEMERQVSQAETDMVDRLTAAITYFQRALTLANTETTLENLNTVRASLAYLHYLDGNDFNAAVLGEFIARHYPANARSKQCAQVALASYLRLYSMPDLSNSQQLLSHATAMANYISRVWKGDSAASDALVTLVDLLLHQERPLEAVEMLRKIPEESAQRLSAELKTGQALWRHHLLSRQESQGTAGYTKDLPETKTISGQLLANAVESMRAARLDAQLLHGALSLCQIYVDTGQFSKSVNLLEDARIGPLAMLEQKHPLTNHEGFATETYKTALRSYIGSLSTAGNPQQSLRRAMSLIKNLTQLSGDNEAQKQTAIYVGLARDIERQISKADDATREILARGFESFLKGAQKSSEDFNTLSWVASTFLSLGNGFDQGDGPRSSDTNRYYQSAAKALEKLMKLVENGKIQADVSAIGPLQLRQAVIWRQLGSFDKALDVMEKILVEYPATLNVQIEAASTLQEWGAEDNSKRLLAIRGDRRHSRTGKNIIWGWAHLARLTAGKEEFRDTFHRARYNLALSRFQYALQTTEVDRATELRRAKRDIEVVFRLYPRMGNPQQQQRYDELLKKVQSSLREKATGLDGLRSASASLKG